MLWHIIDIWSRSSRFIAQLGHPNSVRTSSISLVRTSLSCSLDLSSFHFMSHIYDSLRRRLLHKFTSVFIMYKKATHLFLRLIKMSNEIAIYANLIFKWIFEIYLCSFVSLQLILWVGKNRKRGRRGEGGGFIRKSNKLDHDAGFITPVIGRRVCNNIECYYSGIERGGGVIERTVEGQL